MSPNLQTMLHLAGHGPTATFRTPVDRDGWNDVSDWAAAVDDVVDAVLARVSALELSKVALPALRRHPIGN